MTNITKLKQSEYHTGAILAFENFESLLEISTKAAEINNFGIASSLCVLAMEELTKSVILQLKSINNSIPVNDLDKYFWNHEIKHNAGLDLYLKIESSYENNSDEINSSDDSKSYIVIVVVVIVLFLVWYFNKKNKGEKIEKKNDKSYFDTIKESGFYVGYDKEARQWKSPKDEHNQDSYNNLFELTNDFANKVKNWIFNNKLNRENIIEFVQTLDDKLIDKNQLMKIK